MAQVSQTVAWFLAGKEGRLAREVAQKLLISGWGKHRDPVILSSGCRSPDSQSYIRCISALEFEDLH